MTRSIPAKTACSILCAILSAALAGCGSSSRARTDDSVLTDGSATGSGGVADGSGVAGGGTGGTKSTGSTTATGDTTAPTADTKVAPPDGPLDGALEGIDAVRACKSTISTQPSMGCHSVAECGPTGPAKCCTESPCWPASSCPLEPLMCPSASSRFLCTTDKDCNPGGTCVSSVLGCPQCEYRSCQYPPPPCTPSPDSCGPYGRCQPDGGCAPTLCTAGYNCDVGSRCNVGGPRADGHGCELVPCNDGWACGENARCTAPADPGSHGCTTMTCKNDGDCDCGYCVNGTCADNLGTCSFAPQ
jgi:hypothetical protein